MGAPLGEQKEQAAELGPGGQDLTANTYFRCTAPPNISHFKKIKLARSALG